MNNYITEFYHMKGYQGDDFAKNRVSIQAWGRLPYRAEKIGAVVTCSFELFDCYPAIIIQSLRLHLNKLALHRVYGKSYKTVCRLKKNYKLKITFIE